MTDPPEALPECESKLVYSTMCEYDKEKIYYIVRRGRGKGTPSPKGVTLCCVSSVSTSFVVSRARAYVPGSTLRVRTNQRPKLVLIWVVYVAASDLGLNKLRLSGAILI